jgi:hypothetical protein
MVAGRSVIADEGDILDVDDEQVKASRLGIPTQAGENRIGVPPLHSQIVLNTGGSPDLELTRSAVAADDDAVYNDSRVAQYIRHFRGAPHHRQHQLTVQNERLNWADPGRSVTSACSDEHHPGLNQETSAEFGEIP